MVIMSFDGHFRSLKVLKLHYNSILLLLLIFLIRVL